jgi:hypothetical protein
LLIIELKNEAKIIEKIPVTQEGIRFIGIEYAHHLGVLVLYSKVKQEMTKINEQDYKIYLSLVSIKIFK